MVMQNLLSCFLCVKNHSGQDKRKKIFVFKARVTLQKNLKIVKLFVFFCSKEFASFVVNLRNKNTSV